MAVIALITQYGKSKDSGGWDIDGDSDTDKFLGNIGNTIYSGVDCALTASMREALGNPPDGKWIEIDFTKGQVYRRRIGDLAPEKDKRVDFFNYYAFDIQMDHLGDFAVIRLLPDFPSPSLAQTT